MRLLSFNLQNLPGNPYPGEKARWKRIADHIGAAAPDLCALQEVTAKSFEVLCESLQPADSIFISREDEDPQSEGLALLLTSDRWTLIHSERFWLSETPAIPSISWKASQKRVGHFARVQSTDKSSGSWNILNLHLDHRSRLARRKSLELIRNLQGTWQENSPHPLLICGDFNTRPSSPLMKSVLRPAKDQTLIDTARAVSGQPEPTFAGIGPLKLGRSRFDYILASPKVHVDAYESLPFNDEDGPLSDHRAIVAEVSSSIQSSPQPK